MAHFEAATPAASLAVVALQIVGLLVGLLAVEPAELLVEPAASRVGLLAVVEVLLVEPAELLVKPAARVAYLPPRTIHVRI